MQDLFSHLPPTPQPPDEDAALIAAYERVGRSLDDLPYTDEFEKLFTLATSAAPALLKDTSDPQAQRRAVLHRLHTLRKAARLPRLGRSFSQPPAISREEEDAIAQLVADHVGSLGQRDQLPYTPAFDAARERFAAITGRNIQPRDFWRLIAKLAK
ncbi:MAG: hypothetical protein SFZ24_06490 [Planctomycetota bacterium]|nr:hypothetical protein [Planctomycetota bacterium]